MINYVQIKDNEIVDTQLPEVGTLPDGRMVSGFDKLDADTLKTVGWVPLEDDGPPEYDSATKRVDRTFKIEDDKVTVVYAILDLPPPEPVPEPTASPQEQFNTLVDILVSKGTITAAEVGLIKKPKLPVLPKP